MREDIDKWNELIEKMMVFMENILIILEISKERNFPFFRKKG